MAPPRPVTVYGAYGHTGRFVVAELLRRGLTPRLAGRSAPRLATLATSFPGLEICVAPVDSPAALDKALKGASAVINCAGPFAFTSMPVIEAALHRRIPYLDLAAEPEVVDAELERYDERARTIGSVVAPGVGFYGGLGDLLATAVASDWERVDEVVLAYALSSWKPTAGTRATIQSAERRRRGRRLVFSYGRLVMRPDEAPIGTWSFPAPLGVAPVAEEFTTANCVTLSWHLRVDAVRECMTLAPLGDLRGPELSPLAAVDERGRSDQTFLIEAIVRRDGLERRAVLRGRDIYAVSAPLIVEAAQRILDGTTLASAVPAGSVPAGAIGNARAFLRALTPEYLTVEFTV